jgi:hypothetical protein
MTVGKAEITSISDIPQERWDKLTQKRIFFGHQSVGANIIDGLKKIIKDNNNIKLNIIDIDSQKLFTKPGISHSRIGENRKPESKIIAFADTMNNGIGDNVDIAFFKFCYVDITAKKNINKLFEEYKNSLAVLRDKYKNTLFIHVTVPLRATKPGIKSTIKKILKKSDWEYEDNVKRNEFNQLLNIEYLDFEPIFDLAMIEATYPDGSLEIFSQKGKNYLSLVPDYTDDGGHLNKKGQQRVAEQLLFFLANQMNSL